VRNADRPDASTGGDTDLLAAVRRVTAEFVNERDWAKYQTPKNLSMAMIVEAAELVEHFQWMTPEESVNPDADTRARIADELADVLIYLVRIADVLDIDLGRSALDKNAKNALKYPVDVKS
jgi:NTP pyrophosphatase (non-canonical NTP hydrolase)